MRPGGIFKKSPMWADQSGARLLMKASKAALVDLCIELMQLDGHGSCDDEITPERVRRHFHAILARRGDKLL